MHGVGETEGDNYYLINSNKIYMFTGRIGNNIALESGILISMPLEMYTPSYNVQAYNHDLYEGGLMWAFSGSILQIQKFLDGEIVLQNYNYKSLNDDIISIGDVYNYGGKLIIVAKGTIYKKYILCIDDINSDSIRILNKNNSDYVLVRVLSVPSIKKIIAGRELIKIDDLGI